MTEKKQRNVKKRDYVETVIKIDSDNKNYIKAEAAIKGIPMYVHLNDILEELRMKGVYEASKKVQMNK